MNQQIFIAPAKGIKVRDPDTGTYLPEEGELVTPSTYWTRRLNDGDVTIVEKKAKGQDK